MAIRSAIAAIGIIAAMPGRPGIVFTSDSQYLVKGMREWVPGWIRRGWRRKEGAVQNLALWKELAAAARAHDDRLALGARPRGTPAERVRELPRRARGDAPGRRRAAPSPRSSNAGSPPSARTGACTPPPTRSPIPARFRPAPPLPPEPAVSLFG